MDNAEIKIDPFTSGRTAAGLVFAGVGVRIGDFVFPDEKWTDFVIVILSWWAEAVMGLLHGSERTAELRFMEGPYVAELRAGGGPSWRVSFVEDRLKRRVVYETDIERTSFAQSILAASNEALALCRSRSWWSIDADQLTATAESLRHLLRIDSG
ncbi:MAG: hypothetical protein ACXVDD_00700 [Polyangia bacterium]